MPTDFTAVRTDPPDVDVAEDRLEIGDTIEFITKENRKYTKLATLVAWLAGFGADANAFANELNQAGIAANGFGMGPPVDLRGNPALVSYAYTGQYLRVDLAPVLQAVAAGDVGFEVAVWNTSENDLTVATASGVNIVCPQTIIAPWETVIVKAVETNGYNLIGARTA